MGDPERNGIDTRSLIWQAMGEADIHRRYYIKRRDRLRRLNTACLATSWLAGITGAVLSLGVISQVNPQGGVVAVILAAAITSLRDVFGIPNRIAEARAVAIMTNDEYDEMRLLWQTGGESRTLAAELDSYRRITRANNIIDETVSTRTLEKARQESIEFHRATEAPAHESIIAPAQR